MRGKEDEKKSRGGKLPRVFCYSDEKFRHADWMIMSLEKCENEPAMPVDFEQSLRAEQPRRAVMTSGVSYSIPRNFLSSNPLNPRKPSFLIARTQVSSLSFVLVIFSLEGNSAASRKNTQLSLHRVADETAEIHSTRLSNLPTISFVRFPVYGVTEKSAALNINSDIRVHL